jgi:hypothetical protein
MIHVRWEDTALNQAAALWMAADSTVRQTITSAMNRIDERLRRNPSEEGESRPEDRRILFDFPLGILYRIEPTGEVVSVLRVWHCPKRTKSP